MLLASEIIMDACAQRAGPFAVNDTDRGEMRECGVIQILVQFRDSFIYGLAGESASTFFTYRPLGIPCSSISSVTSTP